MTKKILSLLGAGALALCLGACGGGDDETDAGSDPSPSADTSSSAAPDDESSSPSPEETESSEPSDVDGVAGEYVDLITVLFTQQPPDGGYASAQEFNAGSDFPDGISIGSFDRESQQACIQDENNDISFSISATDDVPAFILYDGLCKGGDEVSRLVPDPRDANDVKIEGDKEIGGAARDALQQRFGG